MKKATRGILALLAGELLVISQKDKKFKTVLKKKKGIDKWKYIATTLFDFNKEIVEKTSNELDSIDFQKHLEELKEKAEGQFTGLQNKVTRFEAELDTLTDEDIEKYISDIKKRYLSLKKKVKKISKDMSSTYALEKKVVAIKEHIDTIRTSLKK